MTDTVVEPAGSLLVLNRPARLESDPVRLDAEYRSARWLHHRLLDFEDEHQRVMDAAAELAAPGVVRVGRILARLKRRARRAERTTKGAWFPNPHPELAARLKVRLDELRKIRDADQRWKDAKKWDAEQVGDPKKVRRRRAKRPDQVQRRKTETEEAFKKRFELLTNDETEAHYAEKLANPPRDSRRDQHRKELYRDRRCYWGTWNALLKRVDAARKAVLKQRKQGMPAEWKRPRWDDSNTIAAEAGGFRVVARSNPWWTIEMRIGTGEGADAEWVRFRAKGGNWHDLGDSKLVACQLTRRRDGARWKYSVSITVDGVKKRAAPMATSRMVAFDWGHREHGHDRSRDGIRAFTWVGDDGQSGEVLIPAACRQALDEIDDLKSRIDKAFLARKESLGLPDRNRHGYRSRLMRSGVKTLEETDWLRWEMRYERRIARRRKRILRIRKETYLQAARDLRRHYAFFAFEDESGPGLRWKQSEDQMQRRKRANRDLSARYEFVALCERFGAEIIPVTSRNTTRECPDCGEVGENGPELLTACSACGRVRDKDYGAARLILRRGQQALAGRSVAA